MAERQPPNPTEQGLRDGRRTLQDLVDAHPTTRTSPMESLLATPDGGNSSTLRLGFPSTDQLARFVAGQHARLLSHLDLPGPLRHTAGSHLEPRRFFVGGRAIAPDLVLTGPSGELVLIFTASPLTAATRLPDPRTIELVGTLGHSVQGVFVTPEPDEEVAIRVSEHLASFATPMHWVRYRIELTVLE